MPRRPSGAPIHDADEQVARVTSESGSPAGEDRHTLCVELLAQAGEWNKSVQSFETSPRARLSASWKRQPATTGSNPDTSADKTLAVVEGKSPDSMADTRGAVKSRTRSPWSCSLLIMITTATAVLFLLATIHSAVTRQLDPQGCVMSRMSPTYIK